MKATEAKAYIIKATKRIDAIQEELNSILDYENEYNKECNLLSKKIKSIGRENYIILKKEVDKKYYEYDNNSIRKNILKVELKNIENMTVIAAAVCLLDELSKQPEKAINKPTYYKVFQDAFDRAKEKAWSEFKQEVEKCFQYPFYSYVSKGKYYPSFDVYARYRGYNVCLGCFIDDKTHILDIVSAKSYVENLPVIDMEELERLVSEALETKNEYARKAAMLEEERKAAMKKYEYISIDA